MSMFVSSGEDNSSLVRKTDDSDRIPELVQGYIESPPGAE